MFKIGEDKMNFNDAKDIDELLDTEVRIDKAANAATDVYVKYLSDVANASKNLIGIHNNFLRYFHTIVKPETSLSSEVKKKIENAILLSETKSFNPF